MISDPSRYMAIGLFATFVLLIFSGYPVVWLMGGLAVLFTVISVFSDNYFDTFFGVDWGYSSIVVARIYAVMNNWVLVALPGLLLGGLYAVFILSYAWLRPSVAPAPKDADTFTIYKGIIPFMEIQLIGVCMVFIFPKIATWLPQIAYGQ